MSMKRFTLEPEEQARQDASRAQSTRRWQFALLSLVLLAYTTLGWSVSLLQSGRIPPTALSTASVALTPLGTLIRDNMIYAVYAVAGVILFMNFTKLVHRRLTALVPAILGCLVLWASMATTMQSPSAGLSHLSLIAIVAVAVWAIGLHIDDLVVLGRVGFAIAAVSLLMAVTTDMAWTDQEADSKALIGDAVLAGFFPQMNPLGMSLAVTLPFTLMFGKRLWRSVGFVTVATSLVFASSRTAVIAVAIALAGGLIIRLTAKAARRFVGYSMFLVVFAATIVVPLRSDDQSFTARGAVWRASLELIADQPLLGYGPNVYGLNGEVAQIINGAFWHGHNVFITFVLIAGYVSIIALALFFIPAINVALREAIDNHFVPFLGVMTIMGLGITEVPIRPSEFDGVAWVTWLALFAIASTAARRREDEGAPHGEDTSKSDTRMAAPRDVQPHAGLTARESQPFVTRSQAVGAATAPISVAGLWEKQVEAGPEKATVRRRRSAAHDGSRSSR